MIEQIKIVEIESQSKITSYKDEKLSSKSEEIIGEESKKIGFRSLGVNGKVENAYDRAS